jgi:hypothetical protein
VAPPAVIPGPAQEYVPPPVPVKVAVVVLHVNVVELDALGVGAVVFCVTLVFAVAVQPFAAVTVNTYVPGKLTDGVAVAPPLVMPGPDHAYVPPPVPVNPIVLVEQVNVDELEAVAMGRLAFCVIDVLAVAVHPLAAVTVTV